MEPHTTPDLTLQLPRDTYWLVVHTLHRSLPPPPTDYPDDQARRDRAAIAEVASMLPGNAEEASLAAQYVATKAYALHCLQAARDHPGDIACLLKCTAQAARMTHEERGLRTLLQRLQAERRRRETNPDATNSAAWVEHCAIGLMAQELPDPLPVPPPAPPPERQPAQASPPEPQPPDPEPWDEDGGARGAGRRGDLSGGSLRGHVSAPRRPDPRARRPAAAVRLRPALARARARHRHRNQPYPARPGPRGSHGLRHSPRNWDRETPARRP